MVSAAPPVFVMLSVETIVALVAVYSVVSVVALGADCAKTL
jgi:hypothetical protein